jgi:hypothetical protein
MFNKDPLEEVARLDPDHETYGRDSFFLDQIPEFDVIINSVNDFGMVSKAIVGSVTLTNYGTTLSIHDIYTEISYTYVARFYIPMTKDVKAFDLIRQLQQEPPGKRASEQAAKTMRDRKPFLEPATPGTLDWAKMKPSGSYPNTVD